MAAVVLLGGLSTLVIAQSADPSCTRESSRIPPSRGATVTPAITLTAEPESDVVNFGPFRGQQYLEVVMAPPKGTSLPEGLTGEHPALYAPKRFRRTSDKLETASLASPTFTEPTVAGDEIAFMACLSGEDVKAGSYTGRCVLPDRGGWVRAR